MATVEISTKVTANGVVIIPQSYTKDIPVGSAVRVLILWEDWAEPTPRVHEESLSLLIARIQGHPLVPAYTPAIDKILAQDWANLAAEVEVGFDPAVWNRLWDEAEAQMEAEEDADQESAIREIHNTLLGI